MKYPRSLKQGTFIKRYKRFFADIEFEGEVITAHCPNTGSMKGCNTEGSECLFSSHDDPKRKLKHTLEAVRSANGESWIGVNTSYPNILAWEAFEEKTLKSWHPYAWAQKEAKINDQSRMDLVLCEKPLKKKFTAKILQETDCPQFHFVEVKNVTLAEDGVALFPDAVTSRGLKHINELTTLIEAGHTAEFLFIIQREDCRSFRPADEIDPLYAEALRQAAKKGLIVSAYACEFQDDELKLVPNPVQVHL